MNPKNEHLNRPRIKKLIQEIRKDIPGNKSLDALENEIFLKDTVTSGLHDDLAKEPSPLPAGILPERPEEDRKEASRVESVEFIHSTDQPAEVPGKKETENEDLSVSNYRILDKSGDWKEFECSSFIHTGTNGVKSLVIISDKIPEAINTVEELTRTRAYQDVIFKHLEGMDVFLLDKDLRFLYSAGKTIQQYIPGSDDITGRFFHELFKPRTRKKLQPLLSRALSGESVRKEIRFTGQIFEINASPVNDQNGEINAIAVISKNITLEKADRDQLRKAKQEAEAADRAKSLFLASMSHEIRTPLNTIIGFANQLTKTVLSGEQKKFIRLIQDSSDQLINVVNELLIVFKIGMGKVFIDKAAFSIRNIFEEIGEIFGPEARHKNLSFEYEVSGEVPALVMGDPFRVKQVLTNITGNAIKYTDAGYVRLSCKVAEMKKRKIWLTFTVEDSGIGIPKEELPYIFDEFRQAKNLENKQRNGTGLGLTITNKLVELQKGKIMVKSTVNKGTTFIVNQPFQRSEEKLILQKNENYQLRHKLLAGKKALLVDDDEQNLLLAGVLFTEWGIKYDTTSSADDGLELSAINRYDVILLDIHMPRISGMDLMRMIRKDKRNPNNDCRIITVTANIVQSDLKRYLAGGFDDYILKPFREAELYNKLCNLLGIVPEEEEIAPYSQEDIAEDESPPVVKPFYSLADLKTAAKGDKDFMSKTIRIFFKNTRNAIDAMQTALKQDDWTEIGETAHKMISAFRYFKCDKVVENLIVIENMALRSSDFTSIPSIVNETLPLIDKTLEKINKEFDFQTI